MSMNDKQTEILEEEVVVNECETATLVEGEKEAKKAEMVKVAKKVLKVAGYAVVGIVGFILGTKVGGKSENNDSEIIDVKYEIEKPDEE